MHKPTKEKFCDRGFSTFSTGFSTGKTGKTPEKSRFLWGDKKN